MICRKWIIAWSIGKVDFAIQSLWLERIVRFIFYVHKFLLEMQDLLMGDIQIWHYTFQSIVPLDLLGIMGVGIILL